MSELIKAKLGELGATASANEQPSNVMDVQFNPGTLRIQISNRTAGGQQAGAQARQRPGTGEVQVSFDLIFDSADEGTTALPVSVLEKTKMVERFVRPRGNSPGQEAPPRVQFDWGGFIVQGTIESANIDLDLFDASGTPLRAKVGVTIKGQDRDLIYPASKASSNPSATAENTAPNTSNANNSTANKLPAGAPGTQGSSQAPARIVQAMPGESLAQLAQRSGFDPAAWRALAEGLSDPLKLKLGQEIALPLSAGAGSAQGFKAQGADPAKTSARLPLVGASQSSNRGLGSNDRSKNTRDPASNSIRTGQALTTRGGLQAAITQIKSQAHQESTRDRLHGFGISSAAAADTADRPWGAGVPLRPRFGSAQGTARRDPTQAGWIATTTTTNTSQPGTRNTPSPRAPGTPTKTGCGCRGRKRPGSK